MDDESINKKCKQKVFASNINIREISIYKYKSRKLFKSPKIGRAPKKKKKWLEEKQVVKEKKLIFRSISPSFFWH